MSHKVAVFGGGIAGLITLAGRKNGLLKPLQEIDRSRFSLSLPQQIAAAAAARA